MDKRKRETNTNVASQTSSQLHGNPELWVPGATLWTQGSAQLWTHFRGVFTGGQCKHRSLEA